MFNGIGVRTGLFVSCLILLLHAPQTHSWVVARNGSVCMIMVFNASILFGIDGYDEPAYIPINALADGSTCGGSYSIFHLEYDLGDYHDVDLSFHFNKTEGNWEITEMEWKLLNLNTSKSDIKSTTGVYGEFTTPLGHYMQCNSEIEIKPISLNFTQIETMQPFATSEDPGEEHTCKADGESGNNNTALIVGCVLAGMALALILCCVCNRMQRRRQHRYNRSRNYVR